MEELPEIVYHYCDIQSFYSIIKSEKIFASLYSSLNDYSESSWFYHLLIEKAKQYITKENEKIINNFLDNFFLNIKDSFITSFSKDSDVLSQWRAYADDGKGVAIGFYTDNFGIKKDVPYFTTEASFNKGIFEVEYSRERQNDLADKMIENAITKNNEYLDKNYDYYILKIKNPSFYEEKEIRIVEILDLRYNFNPDILGLRVREPARHLKYRTRKNSDIVPYREIDIFKEKKIASITMGPKCEVPGKHLELFLLANGVDFNEKILRSKATYR